MPYVVRSPVLCEAFPLNCPYCGMAPASTTVRQPYSKMSPSVIPGHVRSQTWKIALPACGDCASWFSHSRPALFLLGFSALLLPFVAAVTDSSAVPAVGLAAAGAWLGLLIWRRHRMGGLRIAYLGRGEVVYATRSERYASELADRNGLRYEHRTIVVRLA